DAAIIDKLVERGRTAKDFPLADANQDNVLNADDARLVRDVAAGKPAVIWHVNYHDFNGDGTMDEELVSTKFPITSAISTGSTNTLVLEMMLGLADNIKGATYGNTNDAKLLGKTMLNTDRVERIGTSTMKIPFEDGKAGSTNIIAEKNVTAVIADWNRSYLTNEADFEKSNIDVVRVAAAAIDRETTTHTYMLLGLLFQKSERADQLLTLCMDVYDYVENSVKNSEKPKAVASSSNGSISSITSDYTQSVLTAGAEFPLGSIDFAGSSGLAIVEHPEVYLIDFPYLFHIRNQVSYDQSPESLQDAWDTATAPFKDWKYADSGQYVVCAIMPMCLRVAYVATVLHPDTVSIEKVNEFHQKLVDDFFDCKDHFNVSEMKFVLTPEEYAKA
ncbi:MAG: hypothetical protein J5494_08320, partial [Candidatus Methanomethylophilaceae archaeon]|nr:hypothetical protein [Candidatus Methanomethylophilaceae archaeon]